MSGVDDSFPAHHNAPVTSSTLTKKERTQSDQSSSFDDGRDLQNLDNGEVGCLPVDSSNLTNVLDQVSEVNLMSGHGLLSGIHVLSEADQSSMRLNRRDMMVFGQRLHNEACDVEDEEYLVEREELIRKINKAKEQIARHQQRGGVVSEMLSPINVVQFK